MLFPRLQGEHEAGLAVFVHGAAGDAAGHLADKLFGAGHDTQIRAAETERQAEALAFGHGDVRAHLAGSFQDGLQNRIDRDDGHGLMFGGFVEKRGEILDGPEEIGILDDDGRRVVVDGGHEGLGVRIAVPVGHGDQIELQVGRVGGQHDPVDGVHAFGNNDGRTPGVAHGHHGGLI